MRRRMFKSYFMVCLLLVSVAVGVRGQETTDSGASDERVGKLAAEAAMALKSSDFVTAINKFQEASRLRDDDMDLRYELAMAHFKADQLSEMWRVLRSAASRAPGHPKIANGLLSHWRMYDQQGLFNVGVPKSDIIRVLGKPDQAVSVSGRDRLVYGFLAVDCGEKGLHQTLDLRGLTQAHFQPSEIVDIQMDGRGRRVGSRTMTRITTLAEFVLPDERVQNWTELFSVQRLHGMALRSPKMREVADDLLKTLATTHPDREFSFIEDSDDSVLYEWKVSARGDTKAQHELVRLMRGKTDVHRAAFVVRNSEMTSDQRTIWIRLLRHAQLIPLTTPRKERSANATHSSKPQRSNGQKPSTSEVRQKAWTLGGTLSRAVFAHASKTEELAKKELVRAFQLCTELGIKMPPPFKRSDDKSANLLRAVDYLFVDMRPVLESQLSQEEMGVYEVAARTQTLMLFASNEDLRDKALVPIKGAVQRSGLPEGVYRKLKQLLESDDVDPPTIRAAITQLHSDMAKYLAQ